MGVQFIQIQWVLRDGRTLGDRGSSFLHEGEEPVQEHPPVWVAVHVVQPQQVLRALRALEGDGKHRIVTNIDDIQRERETQLKGDIKTVKE